MSKKNPKVLIVDDESEHVEVVAKRLRYRGFEVHAASGGKEALAWLDEQSRHQLDGSVVASSDGSRKPSNRKSGEATRVLLVDDEVEYVETMAERLTARGFVVEFATSGEQAVEKTKNANFDAVVVDYAMPKMDGIATIKALRDVDPGLPFVLLTGNATIKAAMEATRLGAVDVLEKPIDLSTIMEKLRGVFG